MRIRSNEPLPPAWHKWAARDQSWAQALHRSVERVSLIRLLVGVSFLSDGVLWVALVLLLPWLGGASGTACALRMVLLGGLNLFLYVILKRHFARPRPFVTCEGVRQVARSLDEYSFPSGHTLHAVSFAILLGAYYPALAWVAWPFAALVALSRVVLGLHYPSDVLVGGLIGAATARLVLMLF